MATYLSPGIYIEELGADTSDLGRATPRPACPVAAGRSPRGPRLGWINEHSTAAFVGLTDHGPIGDAQLLTSEAQFASRFDPDRRSEGPLAAAVHGFFANGGRSCYVVRIDGHDFEGDTAQRTGLGALTAVPDISAVCAPDVMWLHRNGIVDLDVACAAQLSMIAHCEWLGDRIAILDPPCALTPNEIATWRREMAHYDSQFAALYYPWITVFSPHRGRAAPIPPCGHVAGMWAAVDRSLGPHAPAVGRPLAGVLGVETATFHAERDLLHPMGVNVLASEPGSGVAIRGSRSLSSDGSRRRLHNRRLVNLLGRNLVEGMSWVLRAASPPAELIEPVREHVEGLLTLVWRGGALRGDTPIEAFAVRCDRLTNPAESLDARVVVAEIDAILLDGTTLELRVVHVLG